MLQQLLTLNVFAFFLIFARLGTTFMLLPGFNAVYVTARARLTIAILVTFLVLPVLYADLPVLPPSVAGLALLLIGEVIIGAFMGTIPRVLVASLQVAGTMIALFSSMANAMNQDAITDQQSSIIAGFLSTVGVILVFALDAHHLMIRAAVESYVLFQPGNPLPYGDLSETMARQVAGMFALGLHMAAPFVLTALTYYIGLGILGRLMPALPVFFFGLPIQIMVQTMVLIITLPALMMLFLENFDHVLRFFRL